MAGPFRGQPFFRRADHGCDRGSGQGAEGAATDATGPAGVDARRSEAGERIHPGGSVVNDAAVALDPAPYHRPPGRPAGRAGSPHWGDPTSQAAPAACPSGSSVPYAPLAEDV